MTALPAKSAFTGASVTEGEYKTALETQHDYLTGLLGAAGTQAAALATLGVLGGNVSTRTAAYTVVATDRGHMILCSGTFTLSLTSAATLGAGFGVAVVNAGSGILTVDPAGTETIGGKSALMLAAGASAILISEGAGWQVIGASGAVEHGYQLFTTSGTFNVPPGVTKVKATVIGGGGGGGRGNENYDGSIIFSGGDGGRGGQWVGYLDVTPLGSMAVTVGSGGVGSNTAAGSAGSASVFGSITANGGAGGAAASGSDAASGVPGAISSGSIGFGSKTYDQSTRSRASNSTASAAYVTTGTLYPGAGGAGEYGPSGSNATGGVGGLVLIEW